MHFTNSYYYIPCCLQMNTYWNIGQSDLTNFDLIRELQNRVCPDWKLIRVGLFSWENLIRYVCGIVSIRILHTVSATWEEKKLPKFVKPFQQHADWDHATPVQNETSTCAKWDQHLCKMRPAPVQNETSTCAKWDQRMCRLRPAMKI